jgi:hypothetical protein
MDFWKLQGDHAITWLNPQAVLYVEDDGAIAKVHHATGYLTLDGRERMALIRALAASSRVF